MIDQPMEFANNNVQANPPENEDDQNGGNEGNNGAQGIYYFTSRNTPSSHWVKQNDSIGISIRILDNL